jgi:ribosomal protein L30E
VERKKAKCVVVTPNIERISSPEGGLFEAVEAIVRKSQQNRIIVIFAMTRTSLGKAIAKRLKVAALAILDPSGVCSERGLFSLGWLVVGLTSFCRAPIIAGAEEHYKQALSLAHKGRLDYRRMQKRKSAQEHAHEPGQQPLHESARQQQPPPPPLGEVLSELIQGAIEERTRMEQSPDSTV